MPLASHPPASTSSISGLTSTDEMYFASGSLDAPGAMFTASHNPAQYNGIKLCLSGARPVGADTGLREIMAVGHRHRSAGLSEPRRDLDR